MGYDFTAEELMMQKMARDFSQQEIRPVALIMDQDPEGEGDKIFWDLWRRAAELGLIGVFVPERFGGAEASMITTTLIGEELAAADAGFAVSVGVNWLIQGILMLEGDVDVQEKYLPMISSDQALPVGGCYTEPGGGSDVASVKRAGPGSINTTYRKVDGGYIINGTKSFVTNGGRACFYMVMATEDVARGGQTASKFIVPADLPGVTVGRIENKMGIRSSTTAQISFADVFVSAENLLGLEYGAIPHYEFMGSVSRGPVGGIAVGIARAAYEEALAFAKDRIQGGKTIIEHQGIGLTLAEMLMFIEVGRAIVQKSAWTSLQFDRNPMERLKLACIAKTFCSEMV
ncbi:MAG: acyl-CoA dehydrogenase family protein, partial [Dethiobacteria bacterium]